MADDLRDAPIDDAIDQLLDLRRLPLRLHTPLLEPIRHASCVRSEARCRHRRKANPVECSNPCPLGLAATRKSFDPPTAHGRLSEAQKQAFLLADNTLAGAPL